MTVDQQEILVLENDLQKERELLEYTRSQFEDFINHVKNEIKTDRDWNIVNSLIKEYEPCTSRMFKLPLEE